MGLYDRIRPRELLQKVADADKAVEIIDSGMAVGISSDVTAISDALERRAKLLGDFRIDLLSGVFSLRIDEKLGKLGAIRRRIGQQTRLRKAINKGEVEYLDKRLGFFYQGVRSGEFGPLDVAVVEGIGFTSEGNLIPSYRLGDMPNFVRAAKRVIVQLNTYYPMELEGLHDVYIPENPPKKGVISICSVNERVGRPFIPLDKEKVAVIVPFEMPEAMEIDEKEDELSKQISRNLMIFLEEEVSEQRLPENLLPIEIGLGGIASAILRELRDSQFKDLEFYSAILNDLILDLIDEGKVKAACGSGLYLSSKGEEKLLKDLPLYKERMVLRTVEITDSPEIIMRLGVIALNSAVEIDIYGHVNSSHVMDGNVVSGVGGVSEFALNSFLSIFLMPSITKNGDISTVVPMVAHVDIPEHGVDVVVTEQGIADLRGTTPKERAQRIIACCAHPDYRSALQDYFERAQQHGGGHEPHLLKEAFSFHQRFLETGSMKET